MKTLVSLWYTFLWISEFSRVTAAGGTRLRLLSFLSRPAADGTLLSPSHEGVPSLLPALELAVDQVNDRQDMLDGYQLEAVAVWESGCINTVATTHLDFVREVFGNRSSGDVVGIVSAACPESVLPIAKLASRTQIALVNIHQATSYSFEVTPLKYSFSILSPVSDLLTTVLAFIRHAGWRKISVLYEVNHSFFNGLYREFAARIQAENLELELDTRGLADVSDIENALSAIQSSGYRIILTFISERYALEAMCLSNRDRLTFPNYQWTIVAADQYLCHWDLLDNHIESKVCDFNLRGIFLINHRTKSHTYSDMPSTQQYNSPGVHNSTVNNAPYRSEYGTLLYDSVWALALALNNCISQINERGLSLARYRYGMPDISSIVEKELSKLKFDGLSGNVNFMGSRFSKRSVEVCQIVSDNGQDVVLFAEYVTNNFSVLSIPAHLEIIKDSFPKSTDTIRPAVSAVFFLLVFIHFVLLVSIHIVTLVFRNKKSVKASSNGMNQLVFAGNYLLLCAIFLNNFLAAAVNHIGNESVGRLCQATWPWTLSIGSTLVVGSISLKTWRIYRIFIHYRHPGKLLSDKALTLFLSLLIAIDVFLATIWTATDPISVRVVSEKVLDEDGNVFLQQSTMCFSESISIWLPLIMSYKIILIATLLTLSILTRKITTEHFTTQKLRIISYTFAFTIGCGFTLYFLFFFMNVDEIIDYTILNVVIHSLVLQSIVLVLIPPLIPVIKEKLKLCQAKTPQFARHKHCVEPSLPSP